MRIEIYVNKDCTLCANLIAIVNIAKMYHKFELDITESKDKNVPRTFFYNKDGKKVSTFKGLPAINNPEFNQLVALRYIYQGILDCYTKDEEDISNITKDVEKIDEIVLKDLFEKKSIKHYKTSFINLCDKRKKVLREMIMLEAKENEDKSNLHRK